MDLASVLPPQKVRAKLSKVNPYKCLLSATIIIMETNDPYVEEVSETALDSLLFISYKNLSPLVLGSISYRVSNIVLCTPNNLVSRIIINSKQLKSSKQNIFLKDQTPLFNTLNTMNYVLLKLLE